MVENAEKEREKERERERKRERDCQLQSLNALEKRERKQSQSCTIIYRSNKSIFIATYTLNYTSFISKYNQESILLFAYCLLLLVVVCLEIF